MSSGLEKIIPGIKSEVFCPRVYIRMDRDSENAPWLLSEDSDRLKKLIEMRLGVRNNEESGRGEHKL